MSGQFQLAPLIAVQKRRVEQAMTEVRARNEKVRERESERNTAYQRWEEACAAGRQEEVTHVQSITEHLGQGVHAVGLTLAAQRREWWRLRIEECWKKLVAAEEELGKVRAVAAEAQAFYRKTRAREDALAKLAAAWRGAQAVKSQRAEEQIIEDLLASRDVKAR